MLPTLQPGVCVDSLGVVWGPLLVYYRGMIGVLLRV